MYRIFVDNLFQNCNHIGKRSVDDVDKLPTSYTDIAVVTSPEFLITEEIVDGQVEETLLELKPFIEGEYGQYSQYF